MKLLFSAKLKCLFALTVASSGLQLEVVLRKGQRLLFSMTMVHVRLWAVNPCLDTTYTRHSLSAGARPERLRDPRRRPASRARPYLKSLCQWVSSIFLLTMLLLLGFLSTSRAARHPLANLYFNFCIFCLIRKKCETAQADAIYMKNQMRQNGYICAGICKQLSIKKETQKWYDQKISKNTREKAWKS